MIARLCGLCAESGFSVQLVRLTTWKRLDTTLRGAPRDMHPARLASSTWACRVCDTPEGGAKPTWALNHNTPWLNR